MKETFDEENDRLYHVNTPQTPSGFEPYTLK